MYLGNRPYSAILQFCVLLISLLLGPHASASDLEIRFRGGSSEPLQTPDIHVSNIKTSKLKLIAITKISDTSYYYSHAFYRPIAGEVSTSRTEADSGAYTGLDPFGLFWSQVEVGSAEIKRLPSEVVVELSRVKASDTLVVAQENASNESTRRSFQHIASEDTPLNIHRINNEFAVGIIYTSSKQTESSTKVFMLGGCPESGEISTLARFLSSRGITVFQNFYTKPNNERSQHSCAGDLSGIEKSINWFNESKKNTSTILLGLSRGAEAGWWLQHLNPKLVNGVISYNGTTIQFPSTISSGWSYRGEQLTRLHPRLSNIWNKAKFQVNSRAATIFGLNGENTQRSFLEKEISNYPFEELMSMSIPIHCDYPYLSINAERDENLPVNLSTEILLKSCGRKEQILINPEATHQSFEFGWEQERCPRPLNGTEEQGYSICLTNLSAAKRSAIAIVNFISQFPAQKFLAFP